MKPLRWIGSWAFPLFFCFEDMFDDYLFYKRAIGHCHGLQLGAYGKLISLMVTASKVVVALALFIGIVLLYRRYKGSWKRIKVIDLS